MMMGMTMLASGTVTLIIIAVAVGISALEYLAKKMKQSQQGGKSPGAGGMKEELEQGRGEGESLEEIAARRMRELQTRAQQGGGAAPRMGAGQPGNMTLQQMRERAAAKIAYEKRVAAMRGQGTMAPPPPPMQVPAPTQLPPIPGEPLPAEMEAVRIRQELERKRQAHEQAQRAAAQRRAEIERQKQIAQRRQQQARQPQRAANQPGRPAAGTQGGQARGAKGGQAGRTTSEGMRLGAGVQEVREFQHDTLDTGESTVHRHVSDVETVGAKPQLGWQGQNLRGKLREMVVMREILDPPVGLREDDKSLI